MRAAPILLFLLFTLVSTPAFAQTPLFCGQVVEASFGGPGEQDIYFFTAAVGDTLAFLIRATSGTPFFLTDLFDPDGVNIAMFGSGGTVGPLAKSGVYTLLVRDNNNSVASYNLSLNWVNPIKQCATPYFGFPAAVDLELRDSGGFDVLDRFGGVHTGGGASVMLPATSYFGFDVARDLELTNSFFVLDGFGGVHAGGGASPMIPATPYFGFDIAADMELDSTGFYVLDGFGGVHAGGGAVALLPATPYFGFDIAVDLELATTGYFVLDGFGGMHAGGGASPMAPSTPLFGFNIARDLELTPDGFYVLDGFGGVHAGGGASPMSPLTPYFGFDVAVDLRGSDYGVIRS